MQDAALRWRAALAGWAIPPTILAATEESPWTLPTGLFEQRADRALQAKSPSVDAALQWLPEGGTVLDVGCGPGAASLPLGQRAGRLIGVDVSSNFLAEFRARGERLVGEVVTVEGAWPDVAPDVEVADVVVCANVAYNVPELAGFALALTDHARLRVVLELTLHHPMSPLNDLWLHFHGLRRPDSPTADDCERVLQEAGIEAQRTDWIPPGPPPRLERAEMVAWTRRRLCLPPDRAAEVEAAMVRWLQTSQDGATLAARPAVTFDWAGRGGE
ncbi:MAG: class I SAM-dependent methyltransferase [Candidatus Dormibacteria bacterium]